MHIDLEMSAEALAKLMAKLETDIGTERMIALRQKAANDGVSMLTLLGDAVKFYIDKIDRKEAA